MTETSRGRTRPLPPVRKDLPVPDVVVLIKAQHRRFERLLDAAQGEDADTLALLHEVSDLLVPHSEAEESFVYPAIRGLDSSESDEVRDGTAEHHHIESQLRELLAEDPAEPGYDGKLAAMIGELRHHMEEEEEELLPVLSDRASDDERAQLGARFAEATGSSDTSDGAETRGEGPGPTRDELYAEAKKRDIAGRSSMTKEQLAAAVEPE